MELFINAALITFGILLALFITKVAMNLLIVTLKALTKKVEKKKAALVRQQMNERYNKRDEKNKEVADEMLGGNKELAELVRRIKETPYAEGRTKKAKNQNYERAKLQKTLRELVPNKSVRDVFYTMN